MFERRRLGVQHGSDQGGRISHSYAREKLANAVYAMAIGTGPIKDRLHDAFLEIVPVSERDLPECLRPDYRWIRHELTKNPAKQRALIGGKVVKGFEGRIGATLRTMRLKKAQEIARRICRLADQLEDAEDAT